jgi:hypothetical protein
MNERDLENLVYLLQFSPNELQTWMQTISKDDRAYAMELLTLAPYEIIDIAVSSMLSYDEAFAVIKPQMLLTSFTEAMEAIKPHMLQK